MRRKLTHVIGVVAVAAACVGYTLAVGNEPLLGLDLQGGASVVLEPTRAADPAELEIAVEIIRNRVDGLGVAEPEISTQGGNILVQLPGVDDQQRAIDLVGQTAELRFRPVIDVLLESSYQEALVTVSAAAATDVADVDDAVADEDVVDAAADDADDAADDAVADVDDADDAADDAVADDAVADDAVADVDDVDDAADDAVADDAAADAVADDAVADEDVVEDADAVVLAAEYTIDRFALTNERTDLGSASADAEVVLAAYGDDGAIEFRYLLGPTAVTGESLEEAVSRYDPLGGWRVVPTFKPGADGIDKFNDLAQQCFYLESACPTKRLAIEIDNEVISAPSVQDDAQVFAPFDRANVNITGGFNEQEAKDLALVLNYGVLPIELEAQQSRIVSASLGTDALRAGMVSGLIGLALVSLYLLAYYRLLGLVAIASLALSGSMLWAIIAWLGESQGLALTLAGVTGLIVAIGVSVDSNVVYFEHIKEDVRSGRTVRSATDRAFNTAFSTIVKADMASLIAAVVLYLLTVGQVRGFALYLGLATVLDLVASYFFMGPIVGFITRSQGTRTHSGRFGIIAPSASAAEGRTSVSAAEGRMSR